MKWVVDTKNFHGHSKTYLPDDHTCPFTGKTAEQFQAEGYEVMDEDEFFALYQRFEDGMCGEWKEVTAEEYDEALNVLPPILWYDGGFYIGEAYMSDIHGFYQKYMGRYYTSLQRISTPRNIILESLVKFLQG